MVSTIPKIKATQKRQFALTSMIMRKGSVVVAYYLNKLHIAPHQVVLFRIFIFGGGSLFFFFSSDYYYNLIGLVLVALCYFFDMVDGDLARNHNQVTKFGGFLDMNLDAVILNSIIFTFTIKFFLGNYEHIYTIAGIAILFGTIFSSKMTELYLHSFQIHCGQGGTIIEEYSKTHKLDVISYCFYRLVTPKGLPFSILSNFRDYLLLGVIFQNMPIAILLFSIAINARWILLFIFVTFYYKGMEYDNRKVQLYNLMKQSEK